MPSAERTIVIDRPPDQVFAFFTDPANDERWRSGVKEIRADGPITTGSRVHQVVQGPGGRGIAADIEVTVFEPPSRYAFQTVAGPVRPRGEYRFQPVDSGTEVSFSLSAEVGGIKRLLMGGAVQSSMNGEMANLDRAKAALEAG